MLRRSRDQPRQGPKGSAAARVLLTALLASAATAQSAAAFEIFGLKLWGSSEGDLEVADPLTYAVTLEVVGDDDDLKDKLEDVSSLVDDEDRPVSGSLGLIAKARADREQLIAALYREARYDGVVNVSIAGRPLDDIPPDADFGDGPVRVAITVEPGQVFTLGAVALGGDAADLRPEDYGLAPGGEAGSGVILKAEADIVRALKEEGRPLAKVTGRNVVADHATLTVAVTLTVAAGPVATYGDTTVEGTKDVDNAFTAYMTGLKRGETYSPKDVDDARDRLVDLGVFSSVAVRMADTLDPDGSIPVDVEVSERKFRYYGVGATISNTEGLGLEGYWGHRNLFGRAEKLRIEGSISRIGDTEDYGKLNYNAAILFEKPGVLGPASKFFSSVKTVFEHPDAYDRFSVRSEAGVEYSLTKTQKVSAALALEWSDVEDALNPDGARHFLVSVPLQYVFDNRDNRLDPKEGFRALAFGEPTYDFLTGAAFLKMKGEASAYKSIDAGGKYVAAARFAAGSIVGASLSDIPADRRFYAGGGGSVRGYAYQGIGPKDAAGEPIGGRSYAEGSLEMRIAVTDTLGVVPFIDAGTVSTKQFPDFSDVKFGAGVGLRYLTPFGPLRIDAAIPLNPGPGDPNFGIYAGIGQAF